MHVAKITELFICTDNVKSMGMSWKHRCESIYISGLHTLPLNWARQLCSSHDWSVQLNRKSIILFRLARHTELKMKVWPWGAHRELGVGHPAPAEWGAVGCWSCGSEIGAGGWCLVFLGEFCWGTGEWGCPSSRLSPAALMQQKLCCRLGWVWFLCEPSILGASAAALLNHSTAVGAQLFWKSFLNHVLMMPHQ